MKKHPLTAAICLASSLLLTACIENEEDVFGEDEQPKKSQITRGTIDGFGSVIVGGVHFESDNATFSVDDRNGSQSDLRVGQVVTIKGSHDGKEGVALEIIYDVSVEGPVTSVDANAKTLVVLGQQISIDAMTVLENVDLKTLTVGARVEVSGYVTEAGKIHASFIAMDDEDDGDEELRGDIAELDTAQQTFKIGQQVINYASLTSMELDGEVLANGLSVEIEGRLQGDVFMATHLYLDEEFEFEDAAELELEGIVLAVDTEQQTLNINGLTIRYNDETEFDDGDISDLVVGALVELEGYVEANGIIIAEEIAVESGAEFEVAGKVEATGNGTVTVMGITATVDTQTRVRDERDDQTYFNLAMLQAGDYVTLVLEETAPGQYRARRLEREPADTEVYLSAPISALDVQAGTITVLGLTLDISLQNANLLASLSVGLHVEIGGTYDGTTLTIAELEVEIDD